jgi:hypothetical protein
MIRPTLRAETIPVTVTLANRDSAVVTGGTASDRRQRRRSSVTLGRDFLEAAASSKVTEDR